jgi:cation diffusion facilitator family transporter
MHDGSRRAIIAAFLANLGIAVSKFVAFAFTGSASMMAEAIHSVADTGNQGLLMLGSKRSRTPADDEHPFGYANRRYFYAFLVALVLFSAGGLFAIFEGVEKLRHPHEPEGLRWAVGVLLAALVMEGFSLRTAVQEGRKIKQPGRSWFQFIRRTKNAEIPVVLLEDVAALTGLVFALIGVVLAGVTDEPRWDAAGSLAIGALLVCVALLLAVEMSSLLLGEAAAPEDVSAIRGAMESHGEVLRVIHLRTEQIGPEEIVVAAKLEFRHDLDLRTLADVVDEVEVLVRAAVPTAKMIFIEPDIYRAELDPATDRTS